MWQKEKKGRRLPPSTRLTPQQALCGEEFGHGAAASCCLVLHPNGVPVIHKSHVYQCLLVFLSTILANRTHIAFTARVVKVDDRPTAMAYFSCHV